MSSCNASLNSNQVSHPETVEFILKSDENGTFGFTLQGAGVVLSSNNANDTIQSIVPFPVIGYVEPTSSAEKCSLMQSGDRIVSVNNRSFEGLTVEEARQIIKECGTNLKLKIEFDVAGKFQFKTNF
jgi:C-terminal processing protease CtpA/Prc